jgi:predicted ATPase
MKLERLSIPNYRNLRSFEINFGESQPTTVLIGRNGSGKSNLIEAIVEIFRELELGSVPGFGYQLQYVCRDHTIQLDADPVRPSRRLDITVDGKSLT